MKIYSFAGNGFSSNCYVILDGSGEHAVVIDPSVGFDAVNSRLPTQPSFDYILLTHGHFDHILELDDWRSRTGAPVFIHTEDADMLTDPKKSCFYQFYGLQTRFAPADGSFDDGTLLQFGDAVLKVLHTPGHSGGSTCFLLEDLLVMGDTIFADGGVGRTDLPGGNMMALRASLRSILSMPQHLKIYPGHGDPSTIGAELNNHSYL